MKAIDTELIFICVGELIPFVAAAGAFLFGIKCFFKKGVPLYLQSITMAMGCHALASLYQICYMITNDAQARGFCPSYLGRIGFFLFFITASYGQMDSIVDDGSKAIRPARLISLAGPIAAIAAYIPNLFSTNITDTEKAFYLIIWIPAAISIYFNFKHAIIPDLDFGFIKAIKPYNVMAAVLGIFELLHFTAKSFNGRLMATVCSVAVAALCIATVLAAKRGSEKWTL